MSGAACFGDVCGGHHSPAAVGADSVGPGTIQLWIIGRIRHDVQMCTGHARWRISLLANSLLRHAETTVIYIVGLRIAQM